MARIRTIKPEFWAHEVLSQLPEATHMLAAALLNYADDDGYFNANPGLIRAAAFPLREPSVSIHDMLTQLSNAGYIRLGTGPDGRRYGSVVNFSTHQRINRPVASKIKCLQIEWDNSPTTHPQLSESSPPEWNGMEQGKDTSVDLQSTGQPESSDSPLDSLRLQIPKPVNGTPTQADQVSAVFDHWRETMKSPHSKISEKRAKAIKDRLKDGYTVDQLKQAVFGCSVTPHNMGMNDRDTKYNDVELICRSAGHVDRFIQHAIRPPTIPKEFRHGA